MASPIDPTKPADGGPAVNADVRANLQAAKDEIEALQLGESDAGHSHTLSEITDGGVLARLDQLDTADIADAAVTEAETTVDVVGSYQPENGIPIVWSGTPPLVTPAANAVDIYAFITRDRGASWFGFLAGKAFF